MQVGIHALHERRLPAPGHADDEADGRHLFGRGHLLGGQAAVGRGGRGHPRGGVLTHRVPRARGARLVGLVLARLSAGRRRRVRAFRRALLGELRRLLLRELGFHRRRRGRVGEETGLHLGVRCGARLGDCGGRGISNR
eukprot:24615-Pelagococcus_subviridis.AAC.3